MEILERRRTQLPSKTRRHPEDKQGDDGGHIYEQIEEQKPNDTQRPPLPRHVPRSESYDKNNDGQCQQDQNSADDKHRIYE